MQLNEKTKAHYTMLANELLTAQRRLTDFLHGAALAMGVDIDTHNFDPQTTSFVPRQPPAPLVVVSAVAPSPYEPELTNGAAASA
jgi:hypothetical protein